MPTQEDSKVIGALERYREDWRDLCGRETVQGSSLRGNLPTLFQKGRNNWLHEYDNEFEQQADAVTIQSFLENVIDDVASPISSDDISVISAALAKMRISGFEKIEGYTQTSKKALSWVVNADESIKGLDHVDKVIINTKESSGVEEETKEEKSDDNIKFEIKLKLLDSDAASDEFSQYLLGRASELMAVVESQEKVITMLSDPQTVVDAYKALQKQISRLERELAQMGKRSPKGDFNKIAINKGCKEMEAGQLSGSDLSEDSPSERQGDKEDGFSRKISSARVSDLFDGLDETQIFKLYSDSMAMLVGDFALLKAAFTNINKKFVKNIQQADKIDAILERLLTERSALNDSSTQPKGESDEESQSGLRDKSDAITRKINMILSVKQFKKDVFNFAERKAQVTDYRTFLEGRKNKPFSGFRSLFSGKVAVSRPVSALLLAGLTVAAATVAASAATVAVLHSVAISLAMYSAQRLWAIRQISARHGVAMTDLSADAIHYSSRLEAAVTITPIIISGVAPVILPVKYAAQAAIYCGNVAMRSVYSAFASFFAQRGEIAFDRSNSRLSPGSAEIFGDKAERFNRQHVITQNELTEILKKIDFSKVAKLLPSSDQNEGLPTPIQNASHFVKEAQSGSVTPDLFSQLPSTISEIQALSSKSSKDFSEKKIKQIVTCLQKIEQNVNSHRQLFKSTELLKDFVTQARMDNFENNVPRLGQQS